MGMSTGIVQLGFAIAVAILVNVSDAQDSDLIGLNVCTTLRLRSNFQNVNESYPCWQTQDVPCPHDFFEHHRWRRDRGSRRRHIRPRERESWPWESEESEESQEEDSNNRCTLASLETCYESHRRWVTSLVNEKYCCDGFVEENGGCVRCVDCGWDNGGCQHSCTVDYRGEHHCQCLPGHRLKNDGTSCEDIDECEERPCSGNCVNTDGSYYCSCDNGYTRMLSNPDICIEIDECKIGNGGCEQTCTNTPGAFYCTCRKGFELIEGFLCEDLDECSIRNGNCSHECRNSWGSYKCTCPAGVPLGPDGHTCAGFREPGGEFDEDYQWNEQAESVACGAHNPVLVWGLIILSVALLIGSIIFAVCCVKRRRRRHAAEAPVEIATVSSAYEKPALQVDSEGKLGYTNLAFNQYADPPPSYNNAVYESIDIVPPKFPPKPNKGQPVKQLTMDKLDTKVDVQKMKNMFEG